MLDRLRRQPEPIRQAKSRKIGQKLQRTPLYRRAKQVLCYVAFDGEVETRGILERALSDGKKVFVPVVTDKARRRMGVAQIKDLETDLAHKGHYGIPNPLKISSREISLSGIDLILLPGVAFDRQGSRLGRGAGFFDRFLSRVPVGVPRVGLAFRFQVVARLPREEHDQPVQKVITD